MIVGILLTIPLHLPIVMTVARSVTGMVQPTSSASWHGLHRAATRVRNPSLIPVQSVKHELRTPKENTVDNMTIIAVASIVIAGITIAFGVLGCAGGREGGCKLR